MLIVGSRWYFWYKIAIDSIINAYLLLITKDIETDRGELPVRNNEISSVGRILTKQVIFSSIALN